MICPECSSEDVSVVKSIDCVVFTVRRRACVCGARWSTEERVIKGTLVATGGQGAAPSGQETPQSRKGAKSLSGPIRSVSDLLPGFEASDPDPSEEADQGLDRPRVRGKNLICSSEFEAAWKQYGRKEEKQAAYAAWKVAATSVGGEAALLGLVLGALSWQGPIWAKEGWKFARYFERYLKRRKWEDVRSAAAPTSAQRNYDVAMDWADRKAKEMNG